MNYYNEVVKRKNLPRFFKDYGEFKEVSNYSRIRGGYNSFVSPGVYTRETDFSNIIVGGDDNINTITNNTVTIGSGYNNITMDDDGITFNGNINHNIVGSTFYFDDGVSYGVKAVVRNGVTKIIWSSKHKKNIFKTLKDKIFKIFT